MIQDLFYRVHLTVLTVPATKTATVTSATLDLQNYEGSSFYVSYTTTTDTLSPTLRWVCKLQESDDNSTWTDVAVGDIVDGTSSPTNLFGYVNSNTEINAVYGIGYIGSKRYVRVVCTLTGSASYGLGIGIFALRGFYRFPPTAQTVLQS